MEREELERNEQSMNPVHMMPEQNGIMSAQQELNRIDEQFQRERAERERKEEEEKRRKRDEEEEAARRQKEEEEERKGPPPSLAPRPYGNKTVSALQSSSSTGIYVNFGNSTADQIKQRLQVPPPSGNMTVSPPNTGLTSTGPFSPANDGFDDDDSFISDLPGDDRPRLPQSYYPGLLGSNPGMYRPHDPLDDDALSYTSTEFEDPVQSSAAYGRDRDVLSNISINDPSSLLKVQEYVRDTRRQLEQERNQRAVLDNKLKLSSKEKAELSKKLDSLTQHKSELEQSKLDLEAKIRSLEYGMTEEEEKRKNAEILLSKTKDQLARREEQYAR
ncbi:ankyrin repeat domain-containing protein 26 [Aplysia californica]|uniref:Ankyrin repeat domain-containing protein 26 n=1 Tax=Aplysia californica TaxID=6500 RepID=A0ABM1A6A6_APLCA|nr:ankyrin repeat domain-containing protein 26 [Aplysia californica]